MRSTVASYQARRHPFLAGVVLLVFGPYILAWAVVFALLFAAAVALDLITGRK